MDHTSKSDIALLAVQVRAVPEESLPWFSATVVQLGLMRTSFIIHAIVWLTVRLRGWTPFETWYLILRREPRFAVSLRDALADHITGGTDRNDPRSAGGLDAAEVAQVVQLLKLTQLRQDNQEP